MNYEEYRLLIKAKFDELHSKSYFDTDSARTRAGGTPNHYIAYTAITMVGELRAVLDQIERYANAILDKIRDDRKKEENNRIQRVRDIWNNNTKADHFCKDCRNFFCWYDNGEGYCSLLGEKIDGKSNACGNFNKESEQ